MASAWKATEGQTEGNNAGIVSRLFDLASGWGNEVCV